MGGNGKFSDGLLLGAILGGAAVFLLGTKKGNKVIKVIAEEGLAGLTEAMGEYEDYKHGVKPEPAPTPKNHKAEAVEEIDEIEMVLNQAPRVEKVDKTEKAEAHKKPAKRFFKRK